MREKTTYLVIEPYVHVNITKRRILLFNTLNSKYIEIENSSSLFGLLKFLKEDLYVVELKKSIIKTAEFKLFIQKVYNDFLGFLLTKFSNNKPNQIIPKLMIDMDEYIIGLKDGASLEFPLESLFYISIYLNGKSNVNEAVNSAYPVYKQINSPNSDYGEIEESMQELNYKIIIDLYNTLNNSSLIKFDVLGGNFFEYSRYFDFINLLANKHRRIAFHIFSEDFLYSLTSDKDIISKIQVIEKLNYFVSIYFFNFNVKIVKDIADAVMASSFKDDKVKFVFILTNDYQIKMADNIIKELQINNTELKPYFDGNNLGFFKENVFLSKNDILNKQYQQLDILKNGKINLSEFGRLRLLPNGDVYGNFNNPKLGSITNNDLSYFVNKEMLFGDNWFKIRKNVKPCNECTFNQLCPPLSNLEYVLGKNNLCYKFV